jgi:hypothetical protein
MNRRQLIGKVFSPLLLVSLLAVLSFAFMPVHAATQVSMSVPVYTGSTAEYISLPNPTNIYWNTSYDATFTSSAQATFIFVYANVNEPNQDSIQLWYSSNFNDENDQYYPQLSLVVCNSSETTRIQLSTDWSNPPDVYFNVTAAGNLAVWQSGNEHVITGLTGLTDFTNLIVINSGGGWASGTIYMLFAYPTASATYTTYASSEVPAYNMVRIVDSTASTESDWGTSVSLSYNLGDTIIYQSVPVNSDYVFDSWQQTGSLSGSTAYIQNYTVISPTPGQHEIAVYSSVSTGIGITYESQGVIPGFQGLIVDDTTGAADSGNPVALTAHVGDEVEVDANTPTGYAFQYFLVNGANVGQGTYFADDNEYAYYFYPTANQTEYAVYSLATPSPSPGLTFNPTAFRSDLTAILEMVIGMLLTFGGVFILIKASSAWVVGVIVLLAGFFTLIVSEPNLYGIAAWALSITIFGVFSYSGVQKPK